MSSNSQSSRQKNVHEQLRGDHIETLELLQKSQNENEQLKQQLKKLIAEGSKSSVASPPATDGATDDTLSNLVQNITVQENEIRVLRLKLKQAEVELLNCKNSCKILESNSNGSSKKMSKDSETIRQLQEELEQSNATIEALRSDLAIVSTRSRSSSTVDRSTDKELCIVKAENERLHYSLHEIHENLTKTLATMTGKVADNPDSVYSKTGGINGVIMIKEIDSVYKSVYEELETLKNENGSFVTTKSKLEGKIKELEDEMLRIKMINIDLVRPEALMHMEKHVNELMFCATEDQKKIDHLESLISELRAELKERSLLPLSSTISTQTEAETTDSNFTFEEFVRLKRENKEMKLRLTEVGIGGQLQGRTHSYAIGITSETSRMPPIGKPNTKRISKTEIKESHSIGIPSSTGSIGGSGFSSARRGSSHSTGRL